MVARRTLGDTASRGRAVSPLAVAAAIAACGVGAMLRFGIGTLRTPEQWPWHTLVVNLLGTAILGAGAKLLETDTISPGAALVIGSGLAGGLTTFSTLAVDAVALWRQSRGRAVGYVLITGIGGSAAGLLGWSLVVALA